jgi:glycosyltransferase involved in cell wall biosynthesis
LDTLIGAASLSRDEKLAFVLVGSGPEKTLLQQRVRAENLVNVWFIDPVQKQEIPALLKWFDVAYIGWQHQSIYRFGIAPNKLMDYMMAERPVLHSVNAGNDPVREANCGLTVSPEDPYAVKQGISALLALCAADRAAMGQRGREFVLANHTYPVLARLFLAALR